MSQSNLPNELSDLPNELSDRGIWWQVGGFVIAGCVSVAILQIWDGSSYWAYRSFEIAVKDLYWMFVLPLAGLFEGVRKLFEKASEIRAAQRAKIVRRALEKGHKQGHQQGREQGHQQAMSQIRKLLQDGQKDPATGGIIITPEMAANLLGDPPDSNA